MLLIFSALLLWCSGYSDQKQRPNIIIILTDDHGYADLGAYGLLDDIRTPHLDTLANGGALMTHGYATAPQCIPSRGAIHTAKYQTRFGLDQNEYAPLDIKEITVAERMREAGYATGFIGKWHLEPNRNSRRWMESNWKEGLKQKKPRVPSKLLKPYLPMSRGYTDYYDGCMKVYHRNYDLDGNSIEHERENDRKTFRVDKQSQAALAFIKRHKNRPFFLQLSYFAPHVAIEYVKKHFERFPGDMPERRRWALASIAAIDDGVGAIMNSLRTFGIEDNTIIFFFSDNGAPLKISMKDAPFNEPGWDGSLNGPMVGEKGMISDGGVRVPYIIYWKGHIAPQVYERPVSTMDAGATALALAGAQVSPTEIDGKNLVPHLTGKNKKDPHEALYWRFWGQSAIRQGKWKFFYLANGKRMLFDMESKTPERMNILSEYPEVAERLETQLIRWCNEQETKGLPTQYSREKGFFRHYFGIE